MSSIFGGVAPTTPSTGVPGNNEGIDFTAKHTGEISALSWWQSPTGGPANIELSLYDTQTQAELSSVATSTAGFTAGAWNTVSLPAPVAITPGQVYTAAAFMSVGANFGFTPNGLSGHHFATDLTGLHRTARFDVAGAKAFPVTFSGTESWGVDVVFDQTAPCPECPPTNGFLINLTSPGLLHVVTGVGQCVIEALEQTPAGAPCRQCLLVPSSQIAWDECGPCGGRGSNGCENPGQVAIAIQSAYGSGQFPQPLAASYRKCNHRYEVYQAVVSVTRCLPGMDAAGNPPSCADYLTAAVILEQDRIAVRQAIACCLASANQAHPSWLSEWSIGASTTYPEQGQCGGSETTFLVATQSCLCPD